MKKSLSLLAASLLCTPLLANAAPLQQGTPYAGLNYSLLNYSEEGVSDDAEPTALVGKMGYFMVDQIAVEGRLGLGTTDDTVNVNVVGVNVPVDVEIDRMFGLYLVGHLPLGEQASLYALVGFTDVKATFSAAGYSASDNDSGFTYGFGADLYASEQFGINAEYTQYLDETGYDLSAVSLGVKLHF